MSMQLHPYWISGFVDGEGTFYVEINPHKEMGIGYQVSPEFRVVQHEKNEAVLFAIKKYFGCGVIRVNHEDRKEYRVRSIENLDTIIIPFFIRYPLQTSKKFDFLKFKHIIALIKQKEHLTKEGLLKILDNALIMNRVHKLKAIEIKKKLLE